MFACHSPAPYACSIAKPRHTPRSSVGVVWLLILEGQPASHCVRLVMPPVELDGLHIFASSSHEKCVTHCCSHHSFLGMPCAVLEHVGPLAENLHSYCQSQPK